MLYVFIDGFPNVLERCLTHMDDGRVAIHSLCTYLSSFVALFSVYYHRVKILTVNIEGHLHMEMSVNHTTFLSFSRLVSFRTTSHVWLPL